MSTSRTAVSTTGCAASGETKTTTKSDSISIDRSIGATTYCFDVQSEAGAVLHHHFGLNDVRFVTVDDIAVNVAADDAARVIERLA